MPLAADTALAKRLESISASVLQSFHEVSRSIDAASVAALLRVGGGVATYLSPGSPLNLAAGIGFDGPVHVADVESIEEFFAARGERAVAALCPLADPSAIDAFSQRRWTLSGFENVLVRPLSSAERFDSDQLSAEVREAVTEEERDLWAQIAAGGFSAPLAPLVEQLWVAGVAARRSESRLFIGSVDGRDAGTGELAIDEDIAWLSADTTLPAFRGRGVQQAIQRVRLQAAVDAGCTLAVSEAQPGSASQRNMERLGFRVAYTRVELMAPEREIRSDEG